MNDGQLFVTPLNDLARRFQQRQWGFQGLGVPVPQGRLSGAE